MQEIDIIKKCIEQDSKAQKELYDRYARKMFAVCYRYARNVEDAQDIVQDGFLKIFNKIDTFSHKGAFEGWMRRVMVNTALNFYRKKRLVLEEEDLLEYHQPKIEAPVYSQMSERDLLDLVSSLPDGYRMVFNMYAIEGYSHKEISDMLEIGESTSRSQLVKARKMLQQKIIKIQKTAI